MALDSWLIRVKSALSSAAASKSTTGSTSNSQTTIGILSFEIAGVMSKLLHLYNCLSDHHLSRLYRDSISLPGVRKLVSNDEVFLLSLACAEFSDSLRLAADSISLVLSHRCTDHRLREFHRRFCEFTKKGLDDEKWAVGWREIEGKVRKMERLVAATGDLYREMDGLVEMEQCLRRFVQSSSGSTSKVAAAAEVRRKISLRKQEVKRLKEISLWCRSFDAVTLSVVRLSFTVLARIKQVFHISGHESSQLLPARLSLSAAVHPSADMTPIFVERIQEPVASPSKKQQQHGFFESNLAAIVPPPSTLGAAALALRYANIVVVLEKMVRSPRSIGPDIRDDLYSMLPSSLRLTLRSRLRLVAGCAATDARLASEWQTALAMIVDWLAPLAHNTLRWQSDRSFERRGSNTGATSTEKPNILLLQTLHFAVTEKAEAAVAEMLVGLNYLWRFEMEMAARAKTKAVLLLTSPEN